MKTWRYYRAGAIGMAFCVIASVGATPIARMDIYDKADNPLLFVTFDYNGSGDCVGRSIYAGDSTFLRKTTLQPGGAAAATKENSVDFNDNPLFVTTVNPPASGKTSFSTVDQFGLAQFGPSLSYTEPVANTFDVTQNNGVICKEQYEFDGNGELTRITMLDKGGVLAWYALVSHQATAVLPSGALSSVRPVRLTETRGKIRLQFDLSSAGLVRAELFTPSGRRALTIVNKQVPAGSHLLTADGTRLGNGTYVARMTVNGIASLTRLITVQQ